MRVLVISALFPPTIIGGAEIAAYDFAQWLVRQGHEVGVLTTAASAEDEFEDRLIDGIRTWRLSSPRIYPIARFQSQPAWKKPIWHLQDHLDPRNPAMLARVLDAFQPDFVNIHYLQGIGHNTLAELERRHLPVMFVVNDLGLACVRMSMFKAGRQCESQCLPCRASSSYKARQFGRMSRIGFWSPSRATLDQVGRFFPMEDFARAAIVYPNRYTEPNIQRTASPHPRFVYVGRLHPLKGVDVLLEAAAELSRSYDFSIHIVGGGPIEAQLREKYRDAAWLSFAGHVSQQEVANSLARADVLCIPSIWAEALGMVVVHALTLGVPVIGSRIGGIPELVENGHNGLLVEPGNVVAWRDALETVLKNPALISTWRTAAEDEVDRFSQDALGRKVLAFMQSIRDGNESPLPAAIESDDDPRIAPAAVSLDEVR